METIMKPPHAILITGTSHVGKTTFGSRLANALGWEQVSTDNLARHPGRPWPAPPPAVLEFYLSLSPETVHWFLKVHHENIWPLIQQKIDELQHGGKSFILEGSALRPENIVKLEPTSMVGVCLYADADFLRDRIYREADYEHADVHIRTAIDQFIERSLRENIELQAAARGHGITLLNVADRLQVDNLYEELLRRFASGSEAS